MTTLIMRFFQEEKDRSEMRIFECIFGAGAGTMSEKKRRTYLVRWFMNKIFHYEFHLAASAAAASLGFCGTKNSQGAHHLITIIIC